MSNLDVLIGSSAPMAALRAQLDRLMARPGPGGRLPPVLVLGETGTGKGFLVRIVHQTSAAADLVRLGAGIGSVTAADREGLGAIIGRFPSGFESADLGSARALLREGR